MFKKSILACILLGSSILSAQPYTGKVIADTKSKTALSGVMVSDGLNVVRTNAKGEFTLQGSSQSRFVAITVPNGYRIDRFYQRIDPAKTSYDFALTKVQTDGVARFAQLGDTETGDYRPWIDNIKAYAKNENVDFILHSGDICYEYGIKFHGRELITEKMGTPVYYVLGNHDLIKKVDKPEALYEENFGPVWYSFDVEGTHFIVLPMFFGDANPTYNSSQAYHWLKNDLAQLPKDQKIVVFAHHHYTLSSENLIFKSPDGEIDFNDYNIRAHVIGHWHINYTRFTPKGVMYITSSPANKGGIEHSPSAFKVIDVDSKGAVSSKNIYSFSAMNMAIVSPDIQLFRGKALNISVNAYNSSSPISEVKYVLCLDNGKILSKGTLDKNSDWNFSKSLSSKILGFKDKFSLKVIATAKDGTVAERSRDFSVASSSDIPNKVEGQWTQLRGNAAHNQSYSQPTPSAPKLLWVANAGANIFMASTVVGSGKVFTATLDNCNQGKSQVIAFDAITGATAWKFPSKNAVRNTLIYSDNKIFALDSEGTVYALDAATGREIWTRSLPVNFFPPLGEGMASRGDTLYAGAGNGLMAIKGETGDVIWKNDNFKQSMGTASTMTVAGNTLIASAQWSGLYGIDIKTGKELFRYTDDDLRMRDASASYYDGSVFIGSSKKLYEMDTKGVFKHLRRVPGNFQSTSVPLVVDDLVVTGTYGSGLMAYDKSNFDVRWNVKTGPAIFYTAPYSCDGTMTVDASPVLLGDEIVFGASDGVLRIVSKSDGSEKWKYDTGTPIFSTPSLVDGMMYVADFAGNVYCFVL